MGRAHKDISRRTEPIDLATMKKRDVEVVVISDVHLGTYGSKASELVSYLRTVRPRILILNGDIVDIWQFKKRYFPSSHMKVIRYIISLLAKGTTVYYITGNHDEMLRKFKGFELGGLKILNKLVLPLDGELAWFFHGDVFDVTMKHSKWLAKLGGKGYDLLIVLNASVNWFGRRFRFGPVQFSKWIKNRVKGAVKHIKDFEGTVADIAMQSNYRYVVCGHIHQPALKHIVGKDGRSVFYLNSGDWVENLTALEYQNGAWWIYRYADDHVACSISEEMMEDRADLAKMDHTRKDLFAEVAAELEQPAEVLELMTGG